MAHNKKPFVIRIGNLNNTVIPIPMVISIKGDGKSQDCICCRFSTHHIKTARGCWMCSCPPSKMNYPLFNFSFMDQDIVDALSTRVVDESNHVFKPDIPPILTSIKISPEKQCRLESISKMNPRDAIEELKSLSQYPVINALNMFPTLSPMDRLGVFGSTPPDILHTLHEGLFKYLAFSIFGRLTDSVKKTIRSSDGKDYHEQRR